MRNFRLPTHHALSLRFPALALVVCVALVGCSLWRPSGPPVVHQNPLFIPAVDCDLVWDQIVDSVDDDFDIEREDRVKRVGDVLTVGRIETVPLVSATYLEPWRRDTVESYDRLEATLQSMRRRAVVQVIPTDGGYLVDVTVYKELEDALRPDFAPTAAAAFRNYSSNIDRHDRPIENQPTQAGWIPRGRDPALENQIIDHLRKRLGSNVGVQSPSRPSWF